MSKALAAAAILLAACATAPPLRPADPTQAVPNEASAGTAFADGIRIVVRPAKWSGSDDVEAYLTPIEIAIHNASGRALQVRASSFSLWAPGGTRYDALSPQDVRQVLGPMHRASGGYGYAFVPWGYPFAPWAGPYGRWWGWNGFGPSPFWGPVVYYGGPGYRIPTRALAQGTVDPNGDATVLVFFPVPADRLDAFELDATLADTSGQKLADLRVPFVREGKRAPPIPLPPTATPPAQGGTAPAPPAGSWETTPPRSPPPRSPPPPPPVDTPVGPPVPAPDSGTL